MSRDEKIKFLVLRTLGNFLLLMSLFGVVATFGPALYYEVMYKVVQARGIEFKIDQNSIKTDTVSPGGLGMVLTGEKQQILAVQNTEFSILIPKIGANAKILPNVDPDNKTEYLQKLQEGVAHAKGTVFPGLPGNIYLFAHSADSWWNVGRYNAAFYLIKELKAGDEIVVYFENRRHNYVVTETAIGDSSEVSLLVNSRKDEERLILQTCWPPGTAWKRYLVSGIWYLVSGIWYLV